MRAMATEGLLPGAARRRLYRHRGYRIAGDVEFGLGSVIEGTDVSIASGARLGIGVIIRGRQIHIGRRAEIGSFSIFEGRDFEIGDDTVVREQVFVGGPLFPDSELTLGKRVRVFQSCFLNPSRPLRVGDDTGIGGRSSIFTHGSWQPVTDGFPVAFEPVTIGRNVWLPWHVFILPGVEIGDNATIGAGSVINRSIPAGTLAAGVPARVLRSSDEWPRQLDQDERWDLLLGILEALAAFLTSKGTPAVLERGDQRLVVSVSHDGRERHVVAVPDESSVLADDDVLILLSPHAPERDRVGNAWFDLAGKRKLLNRHDPVSREVDEFLARYGLRFTPSDEDPQL